MSNCNLTKAKKAKNDEFYTLYEDIEAELQHYSYHFRGKKIYCNCDEPLKSEFVHYFIDNFDALGLKSLTATSYSGEYSLLKEPSFGQYLHIEEAIDYTDTRKYVMPLHGNGDFRSKECLHILEQSDVVVTNPPFSLFKEYVATLVAYKKDFLILGNVNAITYRDFFPLLKDNKAWLGASIHSGDREFRVPDTYPLDATSCRIDEDGHKYIRVKGVRWYTTLDYKQRHDDLILYKHYTPEEYPKYDNYDAIEVSKVKDIPCDYDRVMGVPITFLDKYNPEQFDIVGLAKRGSFDTEYQTHVYTKAEYANYSDLNAGPVINKNDVLMITYPRLLIRNKHPEK